MNLRRSDETLFTALNAMRYGLPAALLLAAVTLLFVDREWTRIDGFAMLIGSALSLLVLDGLYRLSASSERDRDAEERARAFFSAHGYWAEDGPESKPRV
jgi:hypothetical protein